MRPNDALTETLELLLEDWEHALERLKPDPWTWDYAAEVSRRERTIHRLRDLIDVLKGPPELATKEGDE